MNAGTCQDIHHTFKRICFYSSLAMLLLGQCLSNQISIWILDLLDQENKRQSDEGREKSGETNWNECVCRAYVMYSIRMQSFCRQATTVNFYWKSTIISFFQKKKRRNEEKNNNNINTGTEWTIFKLKWNALFVIYCSILSIHYTCVRIINRKHLLVAAHVGCWCCGCFFVCVKQCKITLVRYIM